MGADGINLRHAVVLLRADYLPVSSGGTESRPVMVGTVRKLPPPIARQADDELLLKQVPANADADTGDDNPPFRRLYL